VFRIDLELHNGAYVHLASMQSISRIVLLHAIAYCCAMQQLQPEMVCCGATCCPASFVVGNNVVVDDGVCCSACCMNQKKKAIMITTPKLSGGFDANTKFATLTTAMAFLYASENCSFGITNFAKHIVFGMSSIVFSWNTGSRHIQPKIIAGWIGK